MSYRITGLILAILATPMATRAQDKTPPPPPGKSVETVVVTARSAAAAEVVTSIDRKSYSVAKEVAASTGTLADLLRTLPSVDVDPQGNVTLRGDAGVTITIDGKPAGMFSGQSRGQSVQSVPADQFERVEVITNPSAAQSAEGSAGVINLVSKTGRKAGVSGSARLSVGTLGQYATGGTLAYNSAKLALNGDVSWRDRDPQAFRAIEARQETSPQGVKTGQVTDMRLDGFGHIFAGRAGADYDLDPKTRIGGQVRYQVIAGNQPGREFREDDDPLGRATVSQRLIGDSPFWNTDTEGSLSFRRKLDGDQDVTVDVRQERATYSFGRADRTFQDRPPIPDIFTQYVTGATVDTTGAKADYKRTFEGGDELKAGYDLRIDDNRYWSLVAHGVSPGALTADAGLTGGFNYRQAVNAGFVTWRHRFSDLTVLGGLRLEDARTSVSAPGVSAPGGSTETTDRLRPFPSLHLSYALGSDRMLTGSYSRRISRPSPFLLTPVVSYRSERTIQRGNPDLKPAETDSFELGYDAKDKGGSLTATLFWRRIHNGQTFFTREIDDGVLLTTPENLGLSQRAGASVSVTQKLGAKLTATLNGDLYWQQLRGLQLGSSTRSNLSGNARANLSWQVTPADLLQVSLRAQGAAPTTQGRRTGYTILDLGYRRRLTPSLFAVVSALNVNDGWRQAETTRAPGLVYRQSWRGLPPTVTFGLNYTFGVAKKPPPPPAFDFGGGPPS
jgi:outer membrane receptor protein involved in Fe transport